MVCGAFTLGPDSALLYIGVVYRNEWRFPTSELLNHIPASMHAFMILCLRCNPSCAVSQVRALRSFGGGDGPEDVLGALEEAAQRLSWGAKARFVVHIADAPAHGREFNSEPDDQHPHGLPDRSGPSVMALFKARGLEYMLCKVRAAPNTTNGRFAASARKLGAGNGSIEIRCFSACSWPAGAQRRAGSHGGRAAQVL